MPPTALEIIINLATLVGIAMFFSARFFLTAGAPRGYSWNPRNWVPIWRQSAWFRSPGFFLLLAGYAIFALAFIIRTVFLPWPC